MPAALGRALALLIVCGGLGGCSSPRETASPVASASLTLDRSRVAVGTPVEMTYRFEIAADAPTFEGEHRVFVHVFDAGGDRIWVDDHVPPTPIRAWTRGSTVEYTRTTFVPKVPYVGPASVEIGIYSPATGQRLPLAGEERGSRSYRVATLDLALATENIFVVFRDGWHATEFVDEASGQEWQWSRRQGAITFRNPKRDVELFVQLDQPAAAFAEPQRVTIQAGGETIDEFALPAEREELRRIRLQAGQLGEGETVELTIAVDKTFIPADVPSLQSTDSRELGVRVFRVYVRPV